MSYHLAMATFRCLFAHRFVDTKISLRALVRRGKGDKGNANAANNHTEHRDKTGWNG